MTTLDAVCFGFISPLLVAGVSRYPTANGGAIVNSLNEFVCADAPITAVISARLGCKVAYAGNDLGDDEAGRKALRILLDAGVETQISQNSHLQTPLTFTVSTEDGTRTWFSYLPDVLESLMAANLQLIDRANILYVDAYQLFRESSMRAISYAQTREKSLFVNLGGDPLTSELVQVLRNNISILQTSVEEDSIDECEEFVKRGVELGARYVFATMGASGVVCGEKSQSIHLPAFPVTVFNNAGPGAAFSAGVLYGYMRNWQLHSLAKFATATAALFCSTSNGLDQISSAKVEQLTAA